MLLFKILKKYENVGLILVFLSLFAPRGLHAKIKRPLRLRLPCLFDHSNYPPNHPPQRFLQSLSVKRLALAIKFQVTSTYSLTLSGFAFAIACCWSIFAPWWKPHNLPELPFCLCRSFLPYLNRIQLLRRGKFFVASTCFAQSTIITKSFSKVRVSDSDDTRFLATVVKISSTSGVVKPSRTLSARSLRYSYS